MKRFILLAARRSGTTFLLRSLDSHPDIECFKNVFDITRRLRYIVVDRPNSPFHQYRTASPQRQLDYYFRRQGLMDQFLNHYYQKSEAKAVGIRLAYNQAAKYPEILRWAKENQVGVVHLIRKNALKRYVSQVTSVKRGLTHATDPKQIQAIQVYLSPAKLKRNLSLVAKQMTQFEAMLQGPQYLEVRYEDFTARQASETQRLLDFLGVDPHISLTADVIKINSNSLADIVENYDEIRRVLSGTPYEKYLSS